MLEIRYAKDDDVADNKHKNTGLAEKVVGLMIASQVEQETSTILNSGGRPSALRWN
jgi:hypothetical protein